MADTPARNRIGIRRRRERPERADVGLPAGTAGTPSELSDLERGAMAAYLAGREQDSLASLTKAHNVALKHGDATGAARAAFWIAFAWIGAGERTRAAGWVARARRLLDEDRHDCVE